MAQNGSGTDGNPRLVLAALDGLDEVDAVLTALRELARQVSSPVVKACLDGARSDIAYLTGVEGASAEEDGIDHEDCEDCTNEAA